MRAAIGAMVLLLLAAPLTARAHGTFPSTERLVLGDGEQASTLLVQASFGLLLSHDAGVTWGWVCNDVLGSIETEDPRIGLARDGGLLVASFTGLRRADPTGCGWSVGEALDGRVVIDLDAESADRDHWLAVTSNGGRENQVLRSIDDGATWAPTGEFADAILFESIRVAPSRPQRVYLVGAPASRPSEARSAFVFVSDDGAATFEKIPFEPLAANENVRLLAVDPRDPDRVFLRALASSASGASPGTPSAVPERLFRSEDGGATWSEITQLPEVGALAFVGDRVFLGGRFETGLLRSGDDGASFERVSSISVSCLAARGDELWACANEYVDGFAIGRSVDGGASFEPMLVFDQVGATVACDSGAETAATCTPREEWLETTLRPPATTPPPSGCSAAGPRGSAWGVPMECVALAVVLLARRARRDRVSSRAR